MRALPFFIASTTGDVSSSVLGDYSESSFAEEALRDWGG